MLFYIKNNSSLVLMAPSKASKGPLIARKLTTNYWKHSSQELLKKTLIRHRKYKEPWTQANGKDNIGTVLTSHRCMCLTCLEMASQTARTGPRLSTTLPETKSSGSGQCLVPRRMFLKVYEMPLKFLLFFYYCFWTLPALLPSFSFFSQKGCCNWTHRSSPPEQMRVCIVLFCSHPL